MDSLSPLTQGGDTSLKGMLQTFVTTSSKVLKDLINSVVIGFFLKSRVEKEIGL